MSKNVPKDAAVTLSDQEISGRRDAALLRALSTPHKKQIEMKKGRIAKPALAGVRQPEPMLVFDVYPSGEVYRYRLDSEGVAAAITALSR